MGTHYQVKKKRTSARIDALEGRPKSRRKSGSNDGGMQEKKKTGNSVGKEDRLRDHAGDSLNLRTTPVYYK